MPYVITEACRTSKDASCVGVCPVDCIQTEDSADQFFIDPEECIDCGACLDACPVSAIYPAEDVPVDQLPFIELNEKFFVA